MLNRPSSRRKSKKEPINLNLVPMLDALVTLIAFLLFTMSFLAIVSIESPFPESASRPLDEKVKERPVQLTLSIQADNVQIWSPFSRIESKLVPNTPDGLLDLPAIHTALLEIKQKFPAETKIILTPLKSTNYDTLIALMDNIRSIEATDPPLFAKNEATGIDEPVKKLFPEVIFGNLLGQD